MINGVPEVTVARARASQAPQLTAIAQAAKGQWGYPAEWLQEWRHALTVTPCFIQTHPVYTALIHDEMAGFYALGGQGLCLTLEHLWVLPQAMGQGIGGTLFRHSTQQVASLGGKALLIESDPHAEGFYQRMGARRIGQAIGRLFGLPRALPLLLYTLERKDHDRSAVPIPSGVPENQEA